MTTSFTLSTVRQVKSFFCKLFRNSSSSSMQSVAKVPCGLAPGSAPQLYSITSSARESSVGLERPGDRCSAQERDELAPSHVPPELQPLQSR
jgi:hypothetical protein